MLRPFIIAAVPAAVMALAAGSAGAQQLGTAAEAKALEERAITELKAGETAALTKFNKADGGFRDRDLYVFCYNATTGAFDAHANPALLGTDVRALKEKDGSPLGEKILEKAKAAGEGTIVSITYNFPKPGTTNPVPKESFVARVGNEVCGVGYYK
jgi:signal transduction histidine kinase